MADGDALYVGLARLAEACLNAPEHEGRRGEVFLAFDTTSKGRWECEVTLNDSTRSCLTSGDTAAEAVAQAVAYIDKDRPDA